MSSWPSSKAVRAIAALYRIGWTLKRQSPKVISATQPKGHAMTEAEFRAKAIADGFADFQFKQYASEIDGPLHTHNFSVTLLVTEGEFALQFEDRKAIYQTGECCNLAANVMHAERAGSKGAAVLLAKKK